MQCAMARSWMQSRRDATLSAAQTHELDQHLAACGRCAAFARDEQMLQGWLQDAPVEEPAANFEWRLKLRLAQVEREGREPAMPERARPWRPWAQFGVAMATAALVVVAVGSHQMAGRSPVAGTGSVGLRIDASPFAPQPDGMVQPLRDLGSRIRPDTLASFVGPRVPQPYSYFVGHSDSSSSALDAARTPNALEAR